MENNEMYNQEVKEKFLATYSNEETRIPYARIFIKSKPFEEKNKKDLYNFDVAEIKEFLFDLNPLTPAASRTNGRIVSAYIYWALDKGLTKTKFNSLHDVDPEWFEQFVKDPFKIYLTDKELMFGIEDQCNNAQDEVIFRLLFEGVQGTKDCAEICNLKYNPTNPERQDIDFENRTLTLTDYDGSKRKLEVSQRCIDTIEKALKQKDYKKKNGEMETDSHFVKQIVDLVENDYVVRNTISRTDRYESVDKHTIYRRINVIRDVTGFENLTVKSISRSGMIYMAKQLLERDGKLGKEQLQEIAKKYNVKNIYSMTDFINEQTINALYGGDR